MADEEGFLHSLVHIVRWEGPTLVADAVPMEENTNGIYAIRSEQGLGNLNAWVTGEVALSGIVVEGSTGYRAERATIRSLTLLYKRCAELDIAPMSLAAALEERYQVAVVLDGTENSAPSFGASVG